MKKILIPISIIIIIVSIVIYHKSNTVRLFQNVDTESVGQISISYFGGNYRIKDKSQISEIMNYLKSVKFSKCSDNSVPNTTPDAVMGLTDKNGHGIIGLKIYGDVARVLPKEDDGYTVSGSIYSDLGNLCEKYEKNDK